MFHSFTLNPIKKNKNIITLKHENIFKIINDLIKIKKMKKIHVLKITIK